MSVTYVLFGTVEFAHAATPEVERWLEEQDPASRYDLRDLQWWAEAVLRCEGSRLVFFDEGRSSHRRVNQIAAHVERLIIHAVRGELTLQNSDNGHRVRVWKIEPEGGIVRIDEVRSKGIQLPGEANAAREHFRRQCAIQDQQLSMRAPEEVFDEARVRIIPYLGSVLLVRGDADARRRATLEISAVWGPLEAWAGVTPLPNEGDIELTTPLDALSPDAQLALVEALRLQRSRAVVFAEENPGMLVRAGRLREDLYMRLSAGLIDLSAMCPRGRGVP